MDFSNMTKTYIGSLKVGSIFMIDDRPCKITFYRAGKTGKHGAAKAVIKATDLITDKHIETSGSTSSDAWIPKVEKKDFKLLDFDGDFITLMDETSGETLDIKLNETDEFTPKIIKAFEEKEELIVSMLFVNGEERIIGAKKE
jgi:translation initiation factor 5A